MTNQEMRNASGHVKSSDKVVMLMYYLLRDHITSSKLESIVDELEKMENEALFTNGWLAKYAENLASRLEK